MQFFNDMFKFLFDWVGWIGADIGIVGVFRFIQAGREHDTGKQDSSLWVIATGGFLIAIGIAVASGGALKFPTFPGVS